MLGCAGVCGLEEGRLRLSLRSWRLRGEVEEAMWGAV